VETPAVESVEDVVECFECAGYAEVGALGANLLAEGGTFLQQVSE
jgi:hypothetical protein